MLAALFWVAAAGLALPLVLVALTSLSSGSIVGFPITSVDMHWYAAALGDPAYRDAFALSLVLSVGTAVLSVLAGSWIALATAALPRRWMRLVLLGGALLPLVTPGIVHAVALRIAVQSVGWGPGAGAVLLGHVIHATPYAAIMVGARLATLPPDQVDAAHDLGASPVATLCLVVAPWLRPALLGAGALAALTSFDDFIRSFFLGGYEQTLPVLLFARLRSGLSPQVNAVATLVLVAVCLVGWVAGRRGIVRRVG